MRAGTVIFVCLCFTKQFEIYGGLHVSVFNTHDNGVVARLLDLHVQRCGDAVLCRETNGSHVEQTSTFPRPCCIPCSCLPTCETEQNCCPSVSNLPKSSSQSNIAETDTEDNTIITGNNLQTDEHDNSPTIGKVTKASETLLRLLSGNVSTTIATERNAITQTKTFDRTRTESPNSNPNSNDNVQTDCVRPQMFYKQNQQPDSDAYEMISSCPQDVGESPVAEKCKNREKNENIADVVPVTSQLSGLTYINKYCLFCNEQKHTSSAQEWDIQIIDENADYLHKIYNRPQSLIATNVSPYFNLHFVPKDPKLVKKCELYDISSCNQTGYWGTYDEKIYQACHYGPGLPVIDAVNKIPVLLKNIACVLCNSPPDAQNHIKPYCNFFERPKGHLRKTLTVNFNAMVNYEKPEKKKFDVSYIQNSVPQNLDFVSCPPGFSSILGRCRKLLCPRDHYVDMGTCVPLYTKVTGLNFNFRIKVTPLQYIQVVKIRQVAEGLLSVVDDTLARSTILQNHYITLSYLARDNGKVVRYYLFDINICNAKHVFLFSQVIHEIYTFFNEIQTIDTVRLPAGVTVRFKYDIGHEIEESWTGLVDVSHPGDGNFRVLINDEHDNEQGLKNYLTITDIYWCIRTELLPSDVVELGPALVKVKLTETLLFRDQFDFEYHGDIKHFSLYTCVNYFVDDSVKETKSQQTIPNIVKESADIQDDEQTSSATHDKGIATISTVIVIVAIFILVFKVKYYVRKQKLLAAARIHRVDTNSFCTSDNEAAVSAVPVVTIKLRSLGANRDVNPKKPSEDNDME